MLRPALLAAALAAACPAHADDADLAALRAEVQKMKTDYETPIQTLEARLARAEASAATPVASPAGPAQDTASSAPRALMPGRPIFRRTRSLRRL